MIMFHFSFLWLNHESLHINHKTPKPYLRHRGFFTAILQFGLLPSVSLLSLPVLEVTGLGWVWDALQPSPPGHPPMTSLLTTFISCRFPQPLSHFLPSQPFCGSCSFLSAELVSTSPHPVAFASELHLSTAERSLSSTSLTAPSCCVTVPQRISDWMFL